ncbi:MAG: hypothetical protein GY749_40235 [Desulfobacteraceae bacterium]|nr:hypothetical protein [Desulfobacteraceae bacterium]
MNTTQDIKQVTYRIEGRTPLICHKFSEKARKEILAKQKKEKTKGKEARKPEEEFKNSLYRLDDGGYGFPAVAFKAAVVRAGKALDKVMTDLRTAMYVHSEDGELIRINGEPAIREDVVRLNGKTSDLRYRGEFKKWSAEVTFQYDPTVVGEEEMHAIFKRAGIFVGVGEWRIEKGGTFGTWDIVETI